MDIKEKARKISVLRASRLVLALDSSREDRIRTCDPCVPNAVRYRAALLPENRPVERPNAKWVAKIHRFANLAKSIIGFLG
jgi:hypothetical protein